MPQNARKIDGFCLAQEHLGYPEKQVTESDSDPSGAVEVLIFETPLPPPYLLLNETNFALTAKTGVRVP